MSDLNIQVAQNGFIVSENPPSHLVGSQWAFETAESLSDFINHWGEENTKKPEVEDPEESDRNTLLLGIIQAADETNTSIAKSYEMYVQSGKLNIYPTDSEIEYLSIHTGRNPQAIKDAFSAVNDDIPF